MRVIKMLLLWMGVMVATYAFILPASCQHKKTSQDEAVKALQAYQEALEALAGITGTGVAADAEGSYYIRLTFASQKHIDQLIEQNQLPGFLDGVPVEIAIDNPPQVKETIKGNILLRLATDKAAYELGENVMITAYVENQSSQAIHYEYAEHHIHLSIYSSGLDDYVRIGKDGQKYNGEIEIARGATLHPGDSITLDTFWDQKFLDGAREYYASFKRYALEASFVGFPPNVMVRVTIWAGS